MKQIRADRRLQMLNREFGAWTVIAIAAAAGMVTCRCKCGTMRDVYAGNLLKSSTRSCGQPQCRLELNGEKPGTAGVPAHVNRYIVLPKEKREARL